MGEFGREDIEALGLNEMTEGLASASVTIREMNDGFQLLNDTMMKLVRINADIANNQGMKTLEGVGKELNKSKTNTALKSFGKSLETMASAQFMESLGLMEGISAILEALFSPLSLVAPLLQVIAAIVQEAMAPTLIEMTPYIRLAAQYLIENKEAIKAFIQVASPMILILHLLTGNIDAIDNSFKTLGIDLNQLGSIFIMVQGQLMIIQAGFNSFQLILVEFDNKLNATIEIFQTIPDMVGNLGSMIQSEVAGWRFRIRDALDDVRDDMYDEIKGWNRKLIRAIKRALS
jgi:hypothetical protein